MSVKSGSSHHSTVSDIPDTVSFSGSVLTVDDCMDKTKFGWRQFRLLVMSGLMLFNDALTIVSVRHIAESLDDIWNHEYLTKYLPTAMFSGAFIGAFALGRFSDHLGRRWGVLIGMFVMVGGTIFLSGSVNIPMVFIAFFFIGFGVSSIHIGQSLLTEFLSHKNRDLFVTAWAVFWTFGNIWTMLLTEIIIPQHEYWRWFVFIIAGPKALLLIAMWFWIPESPRWLVIHGRTEKAKALLLKYAESRNSTKNFPVYFELKHLTAHKAPLHKIFTVAEIRYAMLVISLMWFTTTGLYYSAILNQAASQLVLFLLAVSELSSYLFQFLAGRFLGRRWGSVVLNVLTIIVFIILAFVKPVVAMFFVARVVLSTTYFFLWLFSPEVFPTSYRSTCMGIANSAARFAAAVIPLSQHFISDRAFDLSAVGLLALGAIGSFIFLKETFKQPLQDFAEEDDFDDILSVPSGETNEDLLPAQQNLEDALTEEL